MYSIVTTPGFVIASRPRGEGGKLLSIFTRELGLVSALAQGLRLEKSKLRYHAQDYAFAEFSLVRGREWWRLTSVRACERERPAERKGNGWEETYPEIRALTARVALLLSRLLHGEEAYPGLFESLYDAVSFLRSEGEGDTERLHTAESVMVLRVLHILGYIGQDAELARALSAEEFSAPFIDALTPLRSSINRHINKALRASHL